MTHERISYSRNFILVNHVIWWMLSTYLLVDGLSGLMRFYTGQDIKVSFLFKLPLLGLLFSVILVLNRRVAALLMGLVSLILLGPVRQVFHQANIEHFILDLSTGVKLLLPIIVFGYVITIAAHLPHLFRYYIVTSLKCASFIFFANIVIGIAGFGFSSYGSGDNGIGSLGFFFAGNEVGAELIVILCFCLQMVWLRSKAWYFVVSLIFIILGGVIATKVAILSAILCALLIPILNERKYIFYLTKRKLFGLGLVFSFSILAALYLFESLLALDVFSRLKWVFEQKGFSELVFSGRQKFVQDIMALYLYEDNVFSYLFGIGVSGVAIIDPKYSSEIDPVDALAWFGLTGLLTMVILCGYFFFKSLKGTFKSSNQYAPSVLLGNTLLIIVSCFAGHVWTSGMLGISWALLNGLLLLNKPDEKHSKNKLVVALK